MIRDFTSHIVPCSRYFWQHFDDECSRSIAALTYMSLFAMVPLMTVMYAVLSGIPAFPGVGENNQNLLFDNLFPGGSQEEGTIANALQQVQHYLSQFSQQARNLTGFGVVFWW